VCLHIIYDYFCTAILLPLEPTVYYIWIISTECATSQNIITTRGRWTLYNTHYRSRRQYTDQRVKKGIAYRHSMVDRGLGIPLLWIWIFEPRYGPFKQENKCWPCYVKSKLTKPIESGASDWILNFFLIVRTTANEMCPLIFLYQKTTKIWRQLLGILHVFIIG
jgi:hypothetical protein